MKLESSKTGYTPKVGHQCILAFPISDSRRFKPFLTEKYLVQGACCEVLEKTRFLFRVHFKNAPKERTDLVSKCFLFHLVTN